MATHTSAGRSPRTTVVVIAGFAVLALVVAAIVVATLAFGHSGSTPQLGGTAPRDTYEVVLEACETGPQATAEGTITNTTDTVQSYTVDVDFSYPDGSHADSHGTAIELAPGESTKWSAPAQGGPGFETESVECAIRAVDEWYYD